MNQQVTASAAVSGQPTAQEDHTGTEMRGVSSLAEYLDWIKENYPDEPDHEYTIFYRGHSDFKYKLEPSAYRINKEGKSFRSVEHHLYSEMLRHSSSDFSEDKTIFERLVRMQHYELPTRLLDLTLNPLIALYFSCREYNDIPGEVISFQRRNNEFCYSHGILDSAFVGLENPVDILYISSQILSNIANYLDVGKNIFSCGDGLDRELIESLNEEIEILRRATEKFDDVFLFASSIKRFEGRMKSIAQEAEIHMEGIRTNSNSATEEKIIATNKKQIITKFQNDFYEFSEKLIKDISIKLNINQHKAKNLIGFILQFTHYIFILPTINNERIRRQQGAFLLFPPITSNHWTLENFAPNKKNVLINSNCKEKIIKELAAFGMSESYIFPELDKLAKDVKLRHPAR